MFVDSLGKTCIDGLYQSLGIQLTVVLLVLLVYANSYWTEVLGNRQPRDPVGVARLCTRTPWSVLRSGSTLGGAKRIPIEK